MHLSWSVGSEWGGRDSSCAFLIECSNEFDGIVYALGAQCDVNKTVPQPAVHKLVDFDSTENASKKLTPHIQVFWTYTQLQSTERT